MRIIETEGSGWDLLRWGIRTLWTGTMWYLYRPYTFEHRIPRVNAPTIDWWLFCRQKNVIGISSNHQVLTNELHIVTHPRPTLLRNLRASAKEFFDVVVSRVQSSQTSSHCRCVPADNFAYWFCRDFGCDRMPVLLRPQLIRAFHPRIMRMKCGTFNRVVRKRSGFARLTNQ